MAYLGFKTLLC